MLILLLLFAVGFGLLLWFLTRPVAGPDGQRGEARGRTHLDQLLPGYPARLPSVPVRRPTRRRSLRPEAAFDAAPSEMASCVAMATRRRHLHGHNLFHASPRSPSPKAHQPPDGPHPRRGTHGEKVELTRRGKRVAMLVSCDRYLTGLRATRPSLDQALKAWRARLPADFEGFSDDEVKSWRDPSVGREVRFG